MGKDNVMDNGLKLLVAPVFGRFYEKYDVSYHEELIYKRGCPRLSRKVVEGYRRGKEAVLAYIGKTRLPVWLYGDSELSRIFDSAFKKAVEG